MTATAPPVRRNRTTATDLAYLMEVVGDLSPKGMQPARIELSLDGPQVVAIVMADRVPTPLAARGRSGPLAIRALVDEIHRVIKDNERKRAKRKRSRSYA